MSIVRSILLRREAGILVMIVLFCAAVGFYKPQFLTLQSLKIILLLTPLVMIGAMAQMLVLVARHVDLSIGSMLGFSAMVVGLMYREYPDIYWLLGFPVAIITGAILGLGNGLLVTIFSLPSIIVTLGTLSLYRGLTFIISDARQINRSVIPTELKVMSRTSPIFDIPWIILIAFGIALMTFIIARHTQLGRQIYALGSNPEAAPLRGIDVTKVTLIVFTLAGALSGLAGILYASRWGFVNPSNTVLASVSGYCCGGHRWCINKCGIGTVMGTVLGVLYWGLWLLYLYLAFRFLKLNLWSSNIDPLLIDRSVRQGELLVRGQ